MKPASSVVKFPSVEFTFEHLSISETKLNSKHYIFNKIFLNLIMTKESRFVRDRSKVIPLLIFVTLSISLKLNQFPNHKLLINIFGKFLGNLSVVQFTEQDPKYRLCYFRKLAKSIYLKLVKNITFAHKCTIVKYHQIDFSIIYTSSTNLASHCIHIWTYYFWRLTVKVSE